MGLFVFGLGIVLLLLGALVIYMTSLTIRDAIRSKSWPQVQARVLSSELEIRERVGSDDKKRTFYYPHVRYAYEVGGSVHESMQVRFGGEQRRLFEDSARGVLADFPACAEVIAYVDPDDSASAVLDRAIPPWTWFSIVLGLALVILGLATATWAVTEFA